MTARQYVRAPKAGLAPCDGDDCLDLEWTPGGARADSGEADPRIRGVRARMGHSALALPHSSVGIAQVFPGESAECVCQGLRTVSGFAGGVPSRVVLDDATGAGRRVCERVRTTGPSPASAAHCGFAFPLCNADVGHERGSVEARARRLRPNPFVPVPRVAGMGAHNGRPPAMRMSLAKEHYARGEPEDQPFVGGGLAMAGLPEGTSGCVRHERPKADKKDRVRPDGRHPHSTNPSPAGREPIAALSATGVAVCEHGHACGPGPTDTCDPASQLALLAVRAGGWVNVRVRLAVPGELRERMGSPEKPDLRAELRLMRDQCVLTGWEATVVAMAAAPSAAGRVDAASVSVAAARIAGGSVVYDEPVDLAEYDRMAGIGEAA
ncbi:IS21 family transposase [Olsenella sp. Marseille-P4559]|uniref:IS21 family transposase n=1 Tax=Olsenella sp. Marseille-P4559 TaxID=2364795 RepID=UPI0010311B99|nr:IS21 family transposase [Olsenella sp. Marseille-P4559]